MKYLAMLRSVCHALEAILKKLHVLSAALTFLGPWIAIVVSVANISVPEVAHFLHLLCAAGIALHTSLRMAARVAQWLARRRVQRRKSERGD